MQDTDALGATPRLKLLTKIEGAMKKKVTTLAKGCFGQWACSVLHGSRFLGSNGERATNAFIQK
jgi:hypothetical protein